MRQSVFHSESVYLGQISCRLAGQGYQGHELNQMGAEHSAGLQPSEQMQNLKKKNNIFFKMWSLQLNYVSVSESRQIILYSILKS